MAETLEHAGHFGDRPGPHLVGVLLEAPLPVVVQRDLRVLQDVEDLLDLFFRDDAAQTDVRRVAAGYHHGTVVGDDAQGQELLDPVTRRPLFDLLDDAETVIWINNLVADLEFLDLQALPPKTPDRRWGSSRKMW